MSDDTSCTVTDNGDDTVTISCDDGTEWVQEPGCTIETFDVATHTMAHASCPDEGPYLLAGAAKTLATPVVALAPRR